MKKTKIPTIKPIKKIPKELSKKQIINLLKIAENEMSKWLKFEITLQHELYLKIN